MISMNRPAIVAIAGALGLGSPVAAQQETASQRGVAVAIIADTVDGHLRCTPDLARLPEHVNLVMHLENRTNRSVMITAPAFFQAVDQVDMEPGIQFNVERGGYLVEPRDTTVLLLRAPRSANYSYACRFLGQPPTILSSGLFAVVEQPQTEENQVATSSCAMLITALTEGGADQIGVSLELAREFQALGQQASCEAALRRANVELQPPPPRRIVPEPFDP